MIYGSQGKFDSAITHFTEAINLNRQFAEAYYNRGFAYEKSGDIERAIADYSTALHLQPAIPRAQYMRDRITEWSERGQTSADTARAG